MLDSVKRIASDVAKAGSSFTGATLDLRTCIGAWLFPKIGRGGTTAISGGNTVGVRFKVHRVINNGTAVGGGMVNPVIDLVGQTAAAASTTVATTSNAGQNQIPSTSGTSFVADDWCCVQDSGGGVTRLEFLKLSVLATNLMSFDYNLAFQHTSVQADTIRNKADVFAPIWLDGGSLYYAVFDYGQATGGDTATVVCLGQTLTSLITQ